MNSKQNTINVDFMTLHHVVLIQKIKEAIENSNLNQSIKIDLTSEDKNNMTK